MKVGRSAISAGEEALPLQDLEAIFHLDWLCMSLESKRRELVGHLKIVKVDLGGKANAKFK